MRYKREQSQDVFPPSRVGFGFDSEADLQELAMTNGRDVGVEPCSAVGMGAGQVIDVGYSVFRNPVRQQLDLDFERCVTLTKHIVSNSSWKGNVLDRGSQSIFPLAAEVVGVFD